MSDLVERLLGLWSRPITDEAAAVAAFREVYADPVRVNGADMTVIELVARARAMNAAYTGIRLEVLDRTDTADRCVIVHRMSAHEAAPPGRPVVALTIDVLVIADGRVTDIWVVSDGPRVESG